MTLFDRYLLRQFFQIYAICFCSLAGLYIVFDAFANLDHFLKYAEGKGGLAGLLAEYYAYRTLVFFDRTNGILLLTAAMFTVSWLQRYNELTVVLAAGVPARRIVKPILVVAVLFTLAAAVNRETVIPLLRDALSRDPKDLATDAAEDFKPRYDNQTDILFRGHKSYLRQQRIDQPNLLLPRGLDRYGRQLAAENAYYRPPGGGRPGGYLLTEVKYPTDLDKRPSLDLDGRPIVLTPRDHDWLEPGQCFVVSELSFDQMTGGSGWKQYSSTLQLIRGLHNASLDFGADVRVAVHLRLVNPLLDLTLLLLGLPLLFTGERTKPFVAVGQCLVVVVVYMLVILGLSSLGSIDYIEPALAAWLPLIIFVPVAAWLSEPFWQ